jgi:rhodanese-related sulfurtransferase
VSVPRPIPSIDPRQASERLLAGPDAPLLVDVREADEFAVVRIPGAVLLPLSRLQEDYEQLPQDRPLILQCASGKRSLAAASFLQQRGYADVTSMDGGVVEWRALGLPISEGPIRPGEGDLPG